jgi:penicillin V acylase-like amidase (Ntn superfamily)
MENVISIQLFRLLKIWIFASLLFALSIEQAAFGCTIVMASQDELVLVGNNEDRAHIETVVSFIPSDGKNNGAILFGYDDAPFQGGMNDKGLFIDGNALPPTGWRAESGKSEWREDSFRKLLGLSATEKDAENFIKYILLNFATVAEVKDFMNKYNHPVLANAKFPVADRTGASMIFEFGQGRVQSVERNGWYQISTNFVYSNITDPNYSCWRYREAEKSFKQAKKLDLPLIRGILKATHQEDEQWIYTVYSNIYDLKSGVVYLYNRSNFEKVVRIDLDEELRKGKRVVTLPSLFDSN